VFFFVVGSLSLSLFLEILEKDFFAKKTETSVAHEFVCTNVATYEETVVGSSSSSS